MADEEYSKEPDEEQGIEEEPTDEEKDQEMETGEKEEEPYDEEGRDNLVDDDEMTPAEEGYSQGYEQAGQDEPTRQGRA